MARISIQDTPTVAPSSSPGNDYNSTQASPAAFGALQGQAEQKLGGDLAQAGQNLDQVALIKQDRFNQTATDDAFNQFQSGTNNLTYGNSADPTAAPGLYTLKGADALNAGPKAVKSISDLRDQIRSGLQNPAQQLQFDEQSRRLMQYTSGEISRHLDQESQNYGIATAKATVDNAAAAGGNAWNSDEALNHSLADARTGMVKQYQHLYGDNLAPELTQEALRKADGTVISAAVLGAAQHDPARAQAILDAHAGNLEPAVQVQLTQHLATVGNQAGANSVVNSAMGMPSGGQGFMVPSPPTAKAPVPPEQRAGLLQKAVAGTPIPPELLGAQVTQESGWDAAATGSVGEIGLGQIKPSTARNPGYGVAGVDPVSLMGSQNVQANLNFQAQYLLGRGRAAGLTDADWQDPAKVSHALTAYNNGGQGGGDPNYAQNVMRNLPADGTPGVTLAAYSGPPGSTASNTAPPMPDYETAAAAVMGATAGNYKQQQMAMSELNRRYAAQKKATAEAYEKSASPLVSQMIADPTKVDPVRDIALNPAFTAEQKLSMSNALSKRLTDFNSDGGDKDAKTYGQGFWGFYKGVTASPDDPGRITDPSVLVKAAGAPGGLTMAGVEKLQSVLAGRRTPEGDADVQMQKTLFSAARQQLVAPDTFGQRDPKGEERFLAFQASAFSAIDAAKKGGATAAEIYSPDSPKYIGKTIASFKRSPAQITADLMTANQDPSLSSVPAPPAQPGIWSRIGSAFSSAPAPDLTTPEGIRAAVQSGQMSRGEAIARLTGQQPAAGGALPMAKQEGQ
jgi:hypothetical protein